MEEINGCHSFSDLPDDVQLSILSFLPPEEVASFSRTSKRFSDLYRDERSRLWRALCDRRWGHLTSISSWGQGNISYKFLYKTLEDWDGLPGFWRQWPQFNNSSSLLSSQSNPPTLMVLEWGPWFLSGSMVSPAEDGTYDVVTTPFLWIWITPNEELACYVDTDARVGKPSDAFSTRDLLPVNLDFSGSTHLRFGTDRSIKRNAAGDGGARFESQETSQIYEYYANRKRSVRHKKREKRLQRWETEHFLKIVDSSPTSDRPLQGLWKGINEEMKLEFYVVTYDILGLSCRRIYDLSGGRLAGCKPVFWTGDATLYKGPLSPEDELIYESKVRIGPRYNEPVHEPITHYMIINSSYDLVLCGLTEVFKNPGQVEGRIWRYSNGNFGFAFLRDDFIVDLRRISENGRIADVSTT